MRKIIVLFLVVSFQVSIVSAQSADAFFSKMDAFLNTYVKNGRVDYDAIKSNMTDLQTLIDDAKKINVGSDQPKVYQAFWINAYNLLVIKSVVDNYPLKSPLDVKGFFDGKKHEVGGTKITLNDIENKLLRGNFKNEARFHFVLVCAGLGCPPIIDSAYLPNTLDEQLQSQTVKAINDPNFIRLNGNKVKISQIFEWYKEDFTRGGMKLADFIDQYREEKLPAKAKLSYYPYDWTLNEKK